MTIESASVAASWSPSRQYSGRSRARHRRAPGTDAAPRARSVPQTSREQAERSRYTDGTAKDANCRTRTAEIFRIFDIRASTRTKERKRRDAYRIARSAEILRYLNDTRRPRWRVVHNVDRTPADPLWWGILAGAELGDKRPAAPPPHVVPPPLDIISTFVDGSPGNPLDLLADFRDPIEYRRGRVVEPGPGLQIARWRDLLLWDLDKYLKNRFGAVGGTGFVPHINGTSGPTRWEEEWDLITIPTRMTYTMHHTVDLKLLPGEVSAPVLSMDIGFNRTSTAATFSATILDNGGWAEALTEESGVPKTVRAEIDGWSHEFVVETWSESMNFDRSEIAIEGYSKSILLGGRFHLPGTGYQSALRTMAQLGDEIIAGTGWTLVWQATDWSVTGGAWSYVGLRPLDALSRLAKAAGAYIETHVSAQTLYVRQNYVVLPWDYATTTPDLAVPEHVLYAKTRDMPIPVQANRIFIAGGEVGGVLVQATRTGSDGSLEAPMIQDPLYTHVDGARARAEQELAALHSPPDVRGIRLPFDNDTIPLLTVGSFIEVQFSTPVRGIVSALTLRVETDPRGAIAVEQEAILGEPPQNIYTGLREISALQPLEVATVTAINGDGTVTVTYPGGGEARPRAAGGETVGANVWVRGNEVQGSAPDLGTPVAISI